MVPLRLSLLIAGTIALAAACAGTGGASGTARDDASPRGEGRPEAWPALASLRVREIPYGTSTIRAFAIGDPDARRVAVFIHGWTGSGAEFVACAAEMARLSPDTVVYCVDLPGSGFSDKPDAAYDIPFFRGAVRACMEALFPPSGSPPPGATLIGHSLGGHIAVDYVAHDGFGVERLVLIAPAGWPMEVGGFNRSLSKNGIAVDSGAAMLNRTFYDMGYRRNVLFDPRNYPGEAAGHAVAGLTSPGGRVALSRTTGRALETDYIDGLLGGLRVPVLLVWGRNDRVLPFSFSSRFLERLPPGTGFAPFDRCGHVPHVEYPRSLAARIVSFEG